MDPVSLSLSILIPAVGWLVEATISKNIEEAWQNYVKSVDLHKDNENLKAELNKIKLLVEAADSATLQGQKVKLMNNYLKEVKRLLYEARDLIDELDYFRLQKEVKEMKKSKHGNALTIFKYLGGNDVPISSKAETCNELKLHKRDMSKRFNGLTQKLKLAYESLNPALTNQLLVSIGNGMQKGTNQMAKSNQSQTTAQPPRDNVYGRDSEKELILKLIKDAEQNSQHLPVVTIVGNGGVGKTTLAKLIYNDSTTSFSKRMWICVSTDFNVERIIREMLEYFPKDDRRCDGQNLNNLTEILRDKLKGERVLVVLDDIWEIKTKKMEWKQLLDQFCPKTSTILVTTRDLSIANMVKTIDPIIQLGGLEVNSVWSLFKKCALGDDQRMVPPELEDIGKAIVKRLQGYPLAVKTVGALLNGKMDRLYWEKVLESEQWKFQEGDGDIMPALRLSYEYLPAHLQQCFSYGSLFPKDYEFKAYDLVYMWMAQDYICTNGGEDVGLDYLETLVDRGFFQTVKNWANEIVYVIHDLMHDLAQAVSSEEILVRNHPKHTLDLPNLRHLSFFPNTGCTIENCVQSRNLSSLVININAKAPEGTLNWHQPNRFRLLALPFMSSISYNFTHLRYLKLYRGLYYNEMAIFPVQICRLYHLQVLELENFNYLSELPKEFNNLVNLRHFIANEELHSMIIGVGRLKHLQELQRFVVREEKGFELCQLSELEKLRGSLTICSLQNVKRREEAERAQLSKKNIDNLELSWYEETDDETEEIEDNPQKNGAGRGKWRGLVKREDRECKTTHASSEEILEALKPSSELRRLCIDSYGGWKSPSWLINHSIKYLESISLSNCEAWVELPNFGQLMRLKKLYLDNLPRVKALGPQFHGCGPHEGFPSLMLMRLSDMDGLETWDWGERRNVFPSLNDLDVSACPRLVNFSLLDPVNVHKESTEWFPMLDQLKITDCSQLQQGRNTEYKRSNDKLKIEHAEGPKALFLIFRISKNIRCMEIKYCSNLTSLLWKCICMIHGLKELRINGCYKLCFSQHVQEENDDGSTSYSHESLKELEIVKCNVTGDELSYLLAHLPALCKLSIQHCNQIGPISLSSIMVERNRSSLEADVVVDKNQQQCSDSLMCLEYLCIEYCPDLVFVNEGGLSGLTALKTVKICDSDKLLYSMIQQPGNNSVQTLKVEQSNVTSLKLYNFVALRKLTLWNCKHLASVEGPNSPASLEVYIRDCPQLAKTQSQVEPKFLMAVEKLNIDNIEFLSIHANSLSMSLHSLIIDGFYSPLEWWIEWTEEQEIVVIKHLTALEELTLFCCNYLCSLPSMLHLHPSLKELTIHLCPEIKYPPQWGFPKTLQKLVLKDCSEKLKRLCSQLEDFECSSETDIWGFTYHVFSKRDPSLN